MLLTSSMLSTVPCIKPIHVFVLYTKLVCKVYGDSSRASCTPPPLGALHAVHVSGREGEREEGKERESCLSIYAHRATSRYPRVKGRSGRCCVCSLLLQGGYSQIVRHRENPDEAPPG